MFSEDLIQIKQAIANTTQLKVAIMLEVVNMHESLFTATS